MEIIVPYIAFLNLQNTCAILTEVHAVGIHSLALDVITVLKAIMVQSVTVLHNQIGIHAIEMGQETAPETLLITGARAQYAYQIIMESIVQCIVFILSQPPISVMCMETKCVRTPFHHRAVSIIH